MSKDDDLATLGPFYRYGMPTALIDRKTVTIVESKVEEEGRLGGLLQRPNTPALNVARGSDMFLNDNHDNECNCYCRCAKRCAQKCELTKLKQGTGTELHVPYLFFLIPGLVLFSLSHLPLRKSAIWIYEKAVRIQCSSIRIATSPHASPSPRHATLPAVQ